MTIQTRVRLGRNATAEEKTIILTKIDEAIAQGVTAGSADRVNDNDPVNRIVSRTWTNLESANNWISFIQTFVPAPAEAVVVES